MTIIPRVYFSKSIDPYFNLALEDYLFRNSKEHEYLLLLYINGPSVILGHFQDPWQECDFHRMNIDKVALVRRQSGGGAVYHDEQNINFSFIGSENNFNLTFHNEILSKVLLMDGLSLEVGTNNSYFINECKCSGSAFKNIKGKKLHHGTLLLNGDAKYIKEILTANNTIIKSRATCSTISKVKSLKEWGMTLDKDALMIRIVETFSCFFSIELQRTDVTEEFFAGNTHFLEEVLRLKSAGWIYGVTPLSEFSNSYLGLQFKVVKGMLKAILNSADSKMIWSGCVSLDKVSEDIFIIEVINKKALSYDRAMSEITSLKV